MARWFERKRIGWGLRPASWQGWLATLVFIAVVVTAGRLLARHDPVLFFVVLVAALAVYLVVARMTSGD
jgi:hypothetical protein